MITSVYLYVRLMRAYRYGAQAPPSELQELPTPSFNPAPALTRTPTANTPASDPAGHPSTPADTTGSSSQIDTSYVRFTITARQACGVDTQVETLVWR